ncbi:hypothetical protein [Streptomyces sp. NPDC052012]|uniref:hypothetical protein n=1 Tax=Streptomyces sp. NPDC052012 TaxID=3155051 RepID=UPI00344C7C52
MPVEGTWNLSIATPIGRTKAVVELPRRHGVLTGTCDTLQGTSRAGRLPASEVIGERRA